MHTNRRLAAIMFTDIAGYTSLMQADEAKALTIRQRHREVFEKWHETYKGIILQYYGDGTLSIFDSAIDAVRCASCIQKEFKEEPHVPLRIGIHTGDIIYSDDDVIGDGVNVASRVESLAEPGSILLSESVQKYLKNQVDISLKSMGTYFFKNVEIPLEVFALDREHLLVPEPKNLKGKYTKKILPSEKNLYQRMPPWAKYIAGLILFLLLAPILYFPLLQFISGNAANVQRITDENGSIIERQVVEKDEKVRFYITTFENVDNDSSLNWAEHAIPYALEMDWDQDPYVVNIYPEFSREKPLNENIDLAQNSGSNFVLTGTVSKRDKLYRIGIVAYKVPSGQISFQREFSGTDLFSLLDTISFYSKRKMGVPVEYLLQVRDLPIAQFLTDSEEAFKFFGQALYLRATDEFFPFKVLHESLEIDSTFSWASNYTSSLYHRYQRGEEKAIKYSERAMLFRKRLPEIFEPEVRLQNYRVKNDKDKVLRLSQILFQLNPESDIYFNQYITELYSQEKYEEVLNEIESWRYNKENGSIYFLFEFECLIRTGKRKKAIKKMQAHLKENPNDESIYIKLGIALSKEKEWDQAIIAFEKAILLNPEAEYYSRFHDHLNFLKDSANSNIDDFTGTFVVETMPDFKFSLYKRNNSLMIRANNQVDYILYPMTHNTFTSDFGFLVKFQRDKMGRVDRMIFKERPNQKYFSTTIKINAEIQSTIAVFEAKNWKLAKEKLFPLCKSFPQHDFLQRMLKHIKFQESLEFDKTKNAYSQIIGRYQLENTNLSFEMKLSKFGELQYIFEHRTGNGPILLYETEKDHFTEISSLNRVYKVIRKNGETFAMAAYNGDKLIGRFIKLKD